MRVTSSTLPNALIDQLGSLLTRQIRLQTQATTGQRFQNADEDPAAAGRVLNLQADAQSAAQYQRNVASQMDAATASYNAIKSLKTISDRANEIAVLADGLKSPDELGTYAKEVNQLIQEAANAANAKDQGHYLFGGTQNGQPPFVSATDPSGQTTAVTYQGNSSVAETEIDSGVAFTAQTVGANTSGSGPQGLLADSRNGADLFQHLISLRDHLAAGDTAAIAATDRPQLAHDEDNLISHISSNGTTQARLTATAASLTTRSQSVDTEISHNLDADLAQTLVQLNATQNAYRVALQSGGTTVNLSLLDFLR